ncbi:MAG: F0F1 ATP synthase subunit delta [Candidatus Gracilibacteria bacterium]|jgi:F-type H+-transporting ATPase subunit delta|nr:F0F1 ATP synthase subunit delta [Candidatus Gracilibacteria bacterium]
MNISINKYSKALSSVLNREDSMEITDKSIENFLKLVERKKQRKILKRFFSVFEKNWQEKNNEINVVLSSAFEMDKETVQILSEFLQEHLNKKPVFRTNIDKSLLGGIKLEFDDKILDLSVRKNLEILRNKFLEN